MTQSRPTSSRLLSFGVMGSYRWRNDSGYTMRSHLAPLFALMIATGCAVGSGAVVKGVGPDDLLKLRDGPGLDHNIIIGLPDGTPLTRQSCAPNNGKVWCKVFVAGRPSMSGYVSADYLAHR